MKIEKVSIDQLHPDPSNVRNHDDINLNTIKASLKKFGQQKPIVVDSKNIVIAGNATLECAKSLGWKEINIVRTDLKGVEAVAYAIADNRTAELAHWSNDLGDVLAALKDDKSIDHLVTGFDSNQFQSFIDAAAGVLPDCADGKQFDESCADDVKQITCPSCGEEFPA